MACVVEYAGNWIRGKVIEIMDMRVDVKLVDIGIGLCNCKKASVMEIEEKTVDLQPQAYNSSWC